MIEMPRTQNHGTASSELDQLVMENGNMARMDCEKGVGAVSVTSRLEELAKKMVRKENLPCLPNRPQKYEHEAPLIS